MNNLLLKTLAQAVLDSKDGDIPELIDVVNDTWDARKKTHCIYTLEESGTGIVFLAMPLVIDAVDFDKFARRIKPDIRILFVSYGFHDFSEGRYLFLLTEVFKPHEIEELDYDSIFRNNKLLAKEYYRCLQDKERPIGKYLEGLLNGNIY